MATGVQMTETRAFILCLILAVVSGLALGHAAVTLIRPHVYRVHVHHVCRLHKGPRFCIR